MQDNRVISAGYSGQMKKTLIALAVLAAILVIVGAVAYVSGTEPVGQAKSPASASASVDYKNATYVIEGKPITLANGYAETEIAPGSASKTVTQYFGNEADGDLNGDGVPDVVFYITQQGGGSGTFYYVAAALKTPTGWQGTNAIFLGDRIAPQTIQIKNGEIIANYADRKPNDPMTAKPSVGVSRTFTVVNGFLVQTIE